MASAAPPPARALIAELPPVDPIVDVLDVAGLEGLALLAATAAGTEYAGVFLLGSDGRRRGGWVGRDGDELAVWESPCGEVLRTRRPFQVRDLGETKDYAIFAHDTCRAYAGAPVLDAAGTPIGAVCVIDVAPRTFDAATVVALEAVAAQASRLVDAARAMDRLDALKRAAEREEHQRTLERSRLEAIISGLHDGVILEDENEDILFINQAFVEILGLPGAPADVIGTSGAEAKLLSAPGFADPAGFLARIKEVVDAGVPVRGDQLITADGRVLERDYVPISVEGLQRGFCWHFRDVTARRRTEAEAALAERRIVAMEDVHPGAIFRLDPTGKAVVQTEEMLEIFGDQVTWPEIVHPDDLPRILKSSATMFAEPRKDFNAFRICPAPGVIKHLEVRTTPLWDADGKFEGFTGTITDVTAERETAEALERSEMARRDEHQRLAMTVAGALDCIVPLDDDGRIIAFNPAAETAFGLTSAEAAGQRLGGLLAPGPVRADGGGRMLGERRLELIARHSSGRTFPVEMAIATTTGEDGSRYATAFLRDISAAKEAEAEREQRLRVERAARSQAEAAKADLETRNDELRRLARVKDEVIAGVSHELRTPLTSMRTFLEMLEEDPAMQPAQLEPLAVISRNASRLERVVADLLDLKDGELDLVVEPVPVEIARLAGEVIEGLAPRAEAAGIALRVDAPLPALALADPARTAQILDILVDNALKFSAPGGEVVVRIWEDGVRAQIEVRDTGCGIGPDELPRVFDRFFQAKGGLESGKGSGLGLSIARILVEAMDGTVEAESTEGFGTSLTIELPIPRKEG